MLLKENEAASQRKCREALEKLADDIKTKENSGTYTRDGGLHDYKNDLKTLQRRYRNIEGLGVKVISAFNVPLLLLQILA